MIGTRAGRPVLLYLNPAAQLGGAELSLLDLMESTRTAVPEAELHLVVTTRGPLVERAEALGVQVHWRPLPQALAGWGDSALRGRSRLAAAGVLAAGACLGGWSAWRYASDLQRLIREVSPDLIHSNGIKAHLLLRLARPAGIPIVWHIRDFIGNRPVVARALRWAAGRGVAGALAVSAAVGRDAQAVLGPRLPVAVIFDGIDVAGFSPGPGQGDRLDRGAGLEPPPPGTLRVGLVATYARWKGHDVFLEALSRLRRGSDIPIRAYIVGGPIYETRGSQFAEAELQALARSLGLIDSVGFVPFQPSTVEVYRALDIVVHASTLPEPFGRTIVEAMACGRPTVVAQAGGAAELFVDGVDALATCPGDADSLANAIRRLSDNPELRRALAEQGRQTATERFDRRRLGPEVMAAYQRLGALSS